MLWGREHKGKELMVDLEVDSSSLDVNAGNDTG